ncbi:metallophosphoesterase [Corynebacterium sp. TAE3-ERU12]|uniref:metallophosphoesterase family protein n=1 Tax=Corynebacterium sp. TAE3-ERU12 TaxID=2849491 RepID=UPI001C459652|nr:metallophosphoesterase [Corynebacterium sp. TAE3-ERU12]MBV7295088.1 metallophosphoesterase [Corynebacterium sp. TAE3-ERU12]
MATTVKFLHTSDWQLGMPAAFLAAGGESVPAEFARARLDAVERLGQVAAEYDCEFIVVAGDVFDTNQPSDRALGRAVEKLRGFDVPVYLLPGNHDSYDPSSVFRRSVLTDVEGVHVLSEPGPVRINDRVELLAAPLLTRHPTDDPVGVALDELEQQRSADDYTEPAARVLVGHGQIEGFGDDALIDGERLSAAIADGTLAYAALGDRHGTLEALPGVWFSGAHEVTRYDDVEKDSGNVLVVELTINDTGAVERRVSPVRVGSWAFHASSAQINSEDDLEAWLTTMREIPHKDRTAVKYDLVGTVTYDQWLRLEDEVAELRELYACLYPRKRLFDLAVVRGDLPADLGLSGYPARAAEALAEASEGQGDAAEASRQAFSLLYRLTRKDS